MDFVLVKLVNYRFILITSNCFYVVESFWVVLSGSKIFLSGNR